MKKIIIFLGILLFYNTSFAGLVEYTKPTGNDIQFGNFTAPYTLPNYIFCGNPIAEAFCIDNGGDYVSHTCIHDGGNGQNLYHFSNGNYRSNITTQNLRINTIICDLPDEFIDSTIETFIDYDYNLFNYELNIHEIDTGSGIIYIPNYTKELSDISKILFQIKILLIIIGFFSLLFVFYTLINDLLGKK